jgi:hyperosmotically inducible periplasmic protein
MFKLIRVAAAVGLLAVCASALSAQSKAEAKTAIADSWITTQVYAKFFVDRDIKARNLTVHTDRGIVTLSGGVESGTEHDRAISAAKSVDGVRQVVDKLSLAPHGKAPGRAGSGTAARETDSIREHAKTVANRVENELSDTLLTTKVQAMFYLDREVKAANIDVTTRGGVVTLTGTVANEVVRKKAVADAKSTDGVRQVVDKLTVTSAASPR